MKFSDSIVVKRPLDDTFDAFLDPNGLRLWKPDLTRTEAFGATFHDLRLKLHFRNGTHHLQTFTDFRKNHVLAFTTETAKYSSRTRMRFLPTRAGTEISTLVNLEPKGIWRFLLPAGEVQKAQRLELEALKHFLQHGQ